MVQPRASAASIQEKKIAINEIHENQPASCYESFEELFYRIQNLKLSGWTFRKSDEILRVFQHDEVHIQPSREIIVTSDLSFTVTAFNWPLPDEHPVYKYTSKTLKNITLSNLICMIMKYSICKGVIENTDAKDLKKHSVARTFNPLKNESTLQETLFYRPIGCEILVDSSEKNCDTCIKFTKKFEMEVKRKLSSSVIPAKLKAPISKTDPAKIKLTLQNIRAENKTLKNEVTQLQGEIDKSAMVVESELGEDLRTIISNTDQNKLSPFMKFFWQEQQKYVQKSRNTVRYHPMIIRYCLALCAKSSAAYDAIRYDEKSGTGFVILPSRRRLRDYKNYIRPERGFNSKIINELATKIKDFGDSEKYVVILLDEIKIQENLVWDKHTGELVGFVDLGDVDLNYATLQKTNEIATHILSFMVRSIVNPFKFSLANFATTCVTSGQIFPLFWKAVGILEHLGLKVMAVTCDGASSNRKFFEMHFEMSTELNTSDVTYRIINDFADELRYIYFICDPPHLIKTARNCLYHSGSGRGSRLMWNDGLHLIWSHVANIFYEDRECSLHLLPKLTFEHIKMSSYSSMNVKLAAQVLSSTVGHVLLSFGPPEAAATAKFCLMMDAFFDIMNIRSPSEYKRDVKPFLAPFSSVDHVA